MESNRSLFFPGAGAKNAPIEPDARLEAYLKPIIKDFSHISPYECAECGTGAIIVQEKDYMICKSCNSLIEYLIDSGPEYRWFGSDDRSPDPTRVGGPINPLLPESSLATRILWRSGDCKAMRRIRQFHLYSAMPSRERTLWNVFEILTVRTVNAGISPSILEESKQLYSQISPRCILRKPQRDALLAACVFESLKRHGSARHPKDVAEMFSVDTSLITKALKQFSELLEEHAHEHAHKFLKHTIEHEEPPLTMSTTFGDYIEAALVRLDIPRTMISAMQTTALELGSKVDEYGICPEATPPSLAALAVALACEKMEHSKSIATIATALDISVATLSKCMKRCAKCKTALFSREL
jgi:transcription initiation factor TFIIB